MAILGANPITTKAVRLCVQPFFYPIYYNVFLIKFLKMMKKLLLFCTVFMMGTVMSFAQFANIGIIGDATPTAWASDTDMTTTDGVTYTIKNFTLKAGTVKFRQDDKWENDWGGTTWPSGKGVLKSTVNIPSQPGLYNITFNLTTLDYNFVSTGNFATVNLVSGTSSSSMFTTDGVMYYANNVLFANAATSTFKVGTKNWGGTAFPNGTATDGGAAIAVPANSYNVEFNATTGAYKFNFVMISLTGSAVGGWGTDADLTTTDGVNYKILNQAFTADGEGKSEVKFRLNHDWGTTWGKGTFPSGTSEVVADGGNMAIPVGNYDVVFNRMSGVFAFSTPGTAGLDAIKANAITAYPNPTLNVWNFNAGTTTITALQIVDVTGKIVVSKNVNAAQVTVDASGLAAGMYFAKVASANATQTIRVVKN